MRLVVGMSGASGAIYGIRLLEALREVRGSQRVTDQKVGVILQLPEAAGALAVRVLGDELRQGCAVVVQHALQPRMAVAVRATMPVVVNRAIRNPVDVDGGGEAVGLLGGPLRCLDVAEFDLHSVLLMCS